MVEPISTTATAAAISAEVAGEAAGEIVREMVISEMARESAALAEVKSVNDGIVANSYAENIREILLNDNVVKSRLENFPENPQEALLKMQELNSDPQFKRALGESYSEALSRTYGDVITQKATSDGSHITDEIITTTKNVKFEHLTFENGSVETNSLYVREGSVIANEVKNGRLNYLIQELKDGHLISQISAGLEMGAKESLVAINKDCVAEMMANPEKAAYVLKNLHDAGGKLIQYLPEFSQQLNGTLEIIR